MHKKQQWIGRKEQWQQLDNNEMTMSEDVDNFMSKSKLKSINRSIDHTKMMTDNNKMTT